MFLVSTITDIMTCKRVLIYSNERSRQQFTAVLYAIVSKFNIDDLYPLMFSKWQVDLYIIINYLIIINLNKYF